ncbi:ABC transporter ATP-binding protein [Xaviernesmea oryzae]|uniref:Branched-chain amino acid transport system ATP-binding protein n=1 Tax=Xaviernesmea oryzae TaxID=464029 RepID=A0A1X7FUG3_9HYPH|nr:ABC transporter ATP-binding protein [Xaviernesmea oryzae]SMF58419.1 branched-chain amino acid transport system ATP-binding protein [Xaviernesmea oryzae]
MLEVADLSLHYGRHVALNRVSIRVGKGETVVILGANGAGKSSLLKSIAGMTKPDSGAIVSFGTHVITGMPAHEVLEAGIALVPEGRGVFGELTVEENLALGAYAKRARAYAGENREFVYDLFPKLKERRAQYVNTMSGGEQQMVAIGRALMSKPDLLMLDEPSLGLAPVVVTELFRSLGRIRERGLALLIVEQNVKMSLSIADRGYLAEAGRISGENTAQALMGDAAVQRAFLGAAH